MWRKPVKARLGFRRVDQIVIEDRPKFGGTGRPITIIGPIIKKYLDLNGLSLDWFVIRYYSVI